MLKRIVTLLAKQNDTIAVCESITGGLFSKSITDIPGASQVFSGGVVAYSNTSKNKLVNIPQDILNQFGAISAECAIAMAQNIRNQLKTNIAISFTGNAGPDSSELKPVGLVYIAVVINEKVICKQYYFTGNRQMIRQQSLEQGCQLLLENLKN